MPRHFTDDEGTARHRRALIAALVAVLALACVGVGALLALHGGQQGEEAPVEEPDDAVPEPETDDAPAEQPAADLPFSLDGVDADAPLVEAVDAARTAELAGEWTFGGDYAQIGSYPLDGRTVFGSATDTPDDISSYRAALISPDGVTYLEDRQTGEAYFEPQDGTGTAERLVWRSSELTLLPASTSDNWRVQTWDAASGETVVLGSAELLNGTPDTPAVGGEVVPTCNETHAFFSSCLAEGDSWSPAVLAFDLSKSEQKGEVIGTGNYPAAIEGGALWASAQIQAGDGTLFGSLEQWDGGDSESVFSVTSDDGSWGISGVWASDGRRVVSFSSTDSSQGSYIGIWDEGFESCLAWVRTPSSRVIASVNEGWVVWGAGSELDNPGMYAFGFADGTVLDLGSSVGYSRPLIASDSNAVIVPECDGQNAAVFHVGELG